MRYVHFILLTIFIFSCDQKFTYDPSNFPELLMVNGFISPVSGIDLTISHTINPFENLDENDISLYISDAFVLLYENTVIVDTIENVSEFGKYFSDYPLSVSDEYKIEVKHKKYPKVISMPLKISPALETVSYKLEEIDEDISLLSIDLPYENNTENFYMITTQGSDQNGILSLYSFLEDYVNNYECYNGLGGNSITHIFYKNCDFMLDNSITFSLNKKILTETNDPIIVENYRILVTQIPSIFFDFPNAISDFVSSGGFFYEPPLSYTNMTGGFGVILPINEKIIKGAF